MKISRRNLVKATVAGVSLAGLNVANAIAETAEGHIFAGRAQGLRGFIGVHVTVGDDGIVAVDVVENSEKPDRLAAAAIAQVVPAIIEGQTVNVDTCTGATFSSMAIKNAVEEALEAAGVADQFQGEAPAVDMPVPTDEECDILIVGSGIAGCNAMLAAIYDDFALTTGDRKVVMIEKQGFMGGSSGLAGGTFWATQPLNSTANIDKYFDAEYPGYYQEGYPLNPQLARNMLEIGGTNALQLQSLGFPFVSASGMGAPEDYTYLQGWYDEPRPAPTKFGVGTYDFAGWKMINFMAERLGYLNADIRLNTRATELVVENGTVTGVVCQTKAGTYTISAKKVILATGGFGNSPALLAEYAPTYLTAIPNCNAGCTGDGLTMILRDVDGVIDGYDNFGGPLGVEMRFGAFNDMGYDFYEGWNFPVGFGCVVVNNEGKRFMADSFTMVGDEHVMPRIVMSQPDGQAWSIFDSANEPAVANAEASAMQDYIFRADTIAELAEAVGIPAEELVATIEAYNDMAASGTDDEVFGVPAADMLPILEPPFYAVSCRGTMCYGIVAARVDEECRVVNASGEVVPNLYAAGEVAYLGSGFAGLGGSMASGRLAGDNARMAIA